MCIYTCIYIYINCFFQLTVSTAQVPKKTKCSSLGLQYPVKARNDRFLAITLWKVCNWKYHVFAQGHPRVAFSWKLAPSKLSKNYSDWYLHWQSKLTNHHSKASFHLVFLVGWLFWGVPVLTEARSLKCNPNPSLATEPPAPCLFRRGWYPAP